MNQDSFTEITNSPLPAQESHSKHYFYTDDAVKSLLINENFVASDLYMYYHGTSSCAPGHTFEPTVREHYVLHYITRGEGSLILDNIEYELKENQGFLLCPGAVSKYIASETNPLHFSWIGFHGLNALFYMKLANLSAENPIFTYNKDNKLRDCLLEMGNMQNNRSFGTSLRMQSYLYLIFSVLIDNNTTQHVTASKNTQYNYVRKSLEYIQENYMNDLNVNKLAEYMNLNRSYLCSIFKKILDTSPQNYIAQYRINKACDLLKNSSYSISDISLMIGYKDYAVFQRYFKKVTGLSPNQYRKS